MDTDNAGDEVDGPLPISKLEVSTLVLCNKWSKAFIQKIGIFSLIYPPVHDARFVESNEQVHNNGSCVNVVRTLEGCQ